MVTKAIFVFFVVFATSANTAVAQRDRIVPDIDGRSEEAWETALQIWGWAEPGYQEGKSSALLAEWLRSAGYRVETGVAGIPTAFVASKGQGKPVIGILAEFDALPGLAQAAVPERSVPEGGGYGHACGHHLFGTASVLAAISLAEQMDRNELPGTIRVYGTPAEEGGGAKVFMAREGLFKDCDAVLHWHPSDVNSAGDGSTLARVAAKFRFHGTASHAAVAPEQGRSALDAVALLNYGAELLREHTPDHTRIHHVITAGGDAPNVVPAFAEAYYYARHPDAKVAESIYKRLVKCAEGAALATETRLEIEFLGGIYNILPNDTLAAITLRNLRSLAPLEYDEEERNFAEKIQKTLLSPKPIDSISEVLDRSGTIGMGSTDVGDVSWIVPTTGFGTSCWAPGTPPHSWQAVAAGGTTIGKKGMLMAAKALALTAWDLAHDRSVLTRAQAELDGRLAEHRYEAMLEPGQPPPLDYRNPPKTN